LINAIRNRSSAEIAADGRHGERAAARCYCVKKREEGVERKLKDATPDSAYDSIVGVHGTQCSLGSNHYSCLRFRVFSSVLGKTERTKTSRT
ncbi:hypothetical protein LINPERHAP1_LOCUS32310, partial [Linum perenne]